MSIPEFSSSFTTIALLLAGIWTIYRFSFARELYPKLLDLYFDRETHIEDFKIIGEYIFQTVKTEDGHSKNWR